MKRILSPLLAVAALLLLTACAAGSHTQKSETEAAAPEKVDAYAAYKQKVVENAQTAECVTAKMSVDLRTGGRNFSLGGSLRMKRDEVIQFSLTFLGMEVGKIEFTPEDVLIITRFNNEYVQAKYAEVDFLSQAQLDFRVLQSLFWNELFVPGQADVRRCLADFRASEAGVHTLLALTDAPKLEYDFLTVTKDATIDRVTVQSKNPQEVGSLVCKYEDFQRLAGKPFPGVIDVTFGAGSREFGFRAALSRLNNEGGWPTRTTVTSKYRRREVKDVLRALMSL
ncbi:MAG: DUF4292 domain-containing protein [Alloprevotella sp.]